MSRSSVEDGFWKFYVALPNHQISEIRGYCDEW